jgi:hypothetical protein
LQPEHAQQQIYLIHKPKRKYTNTKYKTHHTPSDDVVDTLAHGQHNVGTLHEGVQQEEGVADEHRERLCE